MGAQQRPGRRARELHDRERAIVAAARSLAEQEGWEAVTTRRLADRIEYSQPVLYSHFRGKDEIVRAVALEGFAELAAALRSARQAASGEPPAVLLRRLALAWARFAAARPALYDAMFVLRVSAPPVPGGGLAPVDAAFAELRAVTAELAGDRDPDTFTETVWSALHGLVVLGRDGRLRPGHRAARAEQLLQCLAPVPS